ncbi:MAG: hypothetical protein KF895_03190 [Parvibaculum sp.]|nr:hypothetical protein [Parvibaculum sp.]
MNSRSMKGFLLAALAGGFLAVPAAATETYRLIHAIGNDEKEIARGLSKPECEARKREYKTVADALGAYDEAAGYGSITCLPESLFRE